jgi:hypothetical protein
MKSPHNIPKSLEDIWVIVVKNLPPLKAEVERLLALH